MFGSLGSSARIQTHSPFFRRYSELDSLSVVFDMIRGSNWSRKETIRLFACYPFNVELFMFQESILIGKKSCLAHIARNRGRKNFEGIGKFRGRKGNVEAALIPTTKEMLDILFMSLHQFRPLQENLYLI